MYFKLFLDEEEYTGMITDELEKEFERSLKERGFLTKYSRDVEFVFDAYDYLVGLLQTSPCASVDVLIQARGHAGALWSDFLEGVILVRDMTIDEQRCKVRVTIKDTSVFGIFFEMKDFEVSLEETESLNGTVSLTPPLTEIHNFFSTAGVLIIATTSDYAQGYPILDTLDFICQYITDGRLTVASDFMANLNGHWLQHRLSFVTTPVVGETVVVTVEDFRGNTGIATVVSDGNTTNFANEMRAAIILASNRDGTSGVNRIITAFPGGGVIHLNMYCNENIPTFTVTTTGATTINQSVQESYTRNFSDYYISDGYRLTDRNGAPGIDPFQISFDTIWEILNKSRDMSYSIEKVGSDYELRIEPIEYFFDNDTTLTITGARDVETKPIEERYRSSIMLGKEAHYTSSRFETLNCGGGLNLILGKSIRYLTSEIIDQINGAVDYEGDLFIIKCYGDTGPGYDSPVQFVSQSIADPATPGTVTDSYLYNIGMDRANILQDFTFFAPDRIRTNANQYVMTYNAGPQPLIITAKSDPYIGTALQFIQRCSFEHPIKFSDFQALNSRSVISFNTKGGAYRDGHIESLKYNVSTQMAKIKLLVD